MGISRRTLLKTGAILSTASLLPPARMAAASPQRELPEPFRKLSPLGDRIHPVTAEEYRGRIEHAQQLMTAAKPRFAALYVTPGTSLYYYTGVRWGLSERLLALVVPAKGDPMLVCPAFEEGRLRESLLWPIEVRTWQEDQNPSVVAAKWLAERGIRTGRVGIEETTRFTFFNALRHAVPALEYASGDPISIGCRGRKSAHELELMRLACEATFDVYRAVFGSLREGMTEGEIGGLVSQGFARMGLRGGALVLIGASAALPHGSSKPQKLTEGQVVLIDGGTAVEGYRSDVTRCGMLGKPPAKLERAFAIVRQAQDAALATAVRGRSCGSVDDAARTVITKSGFGPDYKYFTHRVGHGIGLDGHEYPYLVRGNRMTLEPGMTFSNEPGIYVVGDYGLRLEDDMVIEPEGPAKLLTPGFSASLEKPADH